MGQLSPSIKFRFVGSDGLALVGGKVYTYSAGTSTPKATYTDYTLGTPNANPVVLDTRGEADIWLSGNYKFVVKDSADTTITTVDQIRDLTTSPTLSSPIFTGAPDFSGASGITWGNPTHSGNHTYSGNLTVQGNTTLGNASSDTLTIAPANITWQNSPTHSSNHTFSGSITIGSSLIVGNDVDIADKLTVNGTLTSLGTMNCTGAVNLSGTTTLNGTTISSTGHIFSTEAPAANFGIYVGNTARSDGTILDWYEEGTFTPGLTFGGGNTGMTFGPTRGGNFTRIGNRVHFDLRITLTAVGSSTGTALITGFPHTFSTSGVVKQVFQIYGGSGLTGLSGNIEAASITNTSTANLIQSSATGHSAVTNAIFTATSDIFVTGTYRV